MKNIVTLNCETCGKVFTRERRKIRRTKSGGQFCCHRCAMVWVGKLPSPSRFKAGALVGELNPHWKGGISKDRMRYKRLDVQRYPERIKARNAVMTAIKSGKLVRQPCEQCGSSEHINAHHDDYSKPLDVRWLCRTCHKAHHLAEKRKTHEPAA